MLADRQRRLFNEFYDAVRDETVLDGRTTVLVGLAAALASGCAP